MNSKKHKSLRRATHFNIYVYIYKKKYSQLNVVECLIRRVLFNTY